MMTQLNWQPPHPALRALLNALAQEITPVYVVGGVVRDHLLRKSDNANDLDLVVPHSALQVSRRVADRLGWAFYPMDEGRDVARLIFASAGADALVCDIARMRGGSIETDLALRDFTINAMAFVMAGDKAVALVDLHGGADDLAGRRLRQVTTASLAEDPVRMLRAVRMAVQFNLVIDGDTRDQILRMPSAVRLASPERLRDELWKIISTAAPATAVEEMRLMGLLPFALPEVALMVDVEQSHPHHLDVYRHTLLAMQYAAELRDWTKGVAGQPVTPASAMWQAGLQPWMFSLRQQFTPAIASGHTRADWLVWHALMHDVGKPTTRSSEQLPDGETRFRFFEHEAVGAAQTQQRLTELKFSALEIELATAVVRNHMRPHLLDVSFNGQAISRRAAYRYFRDLGARVAEQPTGVDVLLLALADYQAIYAQTPPPGFTGYLEHVQQLLNFALTERSMEKTQQRPLVDGHTLMRTFGIAPGRQVGQILEQLAEAYAANEIATREDALALADRLLSEQGST